MSFAQGSWSKIESHATALLLKFNMAPPFDRGPADSATFSMWRLCGFKFNMAPPFDKGPADSATFSTWRLCGFKFNMAPPFDKGPADSATFSFRGGLM
jgi:hypothetical protein